MRAMSLAVLRAGMQGTSVPPSLTLPLVLSLLTPLSPGAAGAAPPDTATDTAEDAVTGAAAATPDAPRDSGSSTTDRGPSSSVMSDSDTGSSDKSHIDDSLKSCDQENGHQILQFVKVNLKHNHAIKRDLKDPNFILIPKVKVIRISVFYRQIANYHYYGKKRTSK